MQEPSNIEKVPYHIVRDFSINMFETNELRIKNKFKKEQEQGQELGVEWSRRRKEGRSRIRSRGQRD